MQGWGRSRLVAASTMAVAFAAAFGTLSASGFDPGIPFSQKPVRDPEPVVLTGSQFPTWSAGPEFTLHEPMSPLNSSTVGQQGSEPSLLQSNCYDPQGVTYGGGGYTDNGDHNCYQSSRLPVRTNPALKGVDPRRIIGYRWDGHNFQMVHHASMAAPPVQ